MMHLLKLLRVRVLACDADAWRTIEVRTNERKSYSASIGRMQHYPHHSKWMSLSSSWVTRGRLVTMRNLPQPEAQAPGEEVVRRCHQFPTQSTEIVKIERWEGAGISVQAVLQRLSFRLCSSAPQPDEQHLQNRELGIARKERTAAADRRSATTVVREVGTSRLSNADPLMRSTRCRSDDWRVSEELSVDFRLSLMEYSCKPAGHWPPDTRAISRVRSSQ